MKILLMALVTLVFVASCKKTNDPTPPFAETKIDLTTHKLTSFSAITSTKYLVVFESGLGN
ncbi:hypothetical protein MUK70_10795 [Dyadobacter chenwenxiniae]|uniref:Uncharacterized protein n=1 Tax=Dyadobacter chenwenxiniae TaxID=2906456 RepID=A0A9X1TGH2_9BACT|nr:hypothetical protein [Dyadobacter chenwenxiniae]MCF0065561.1 hypothetical protein [Dyadobacter chenwenxiniae]UON85472.1 hypothetical protein MUK70_10795 [Dyadobacter chenwenxiniae]